MKVSELITLLAKLPSDMELWKINGASSTPVASARDMGFMVVENVLAHIYNADPIGVNLEDYVKPDVIEYGVAVEPDEEQPKAKRKRGADVGN